MVTKGQFSAIIELQSVDSTNNYALQLAREGMAYHGLAVFAHEQLAGKGQRGKAWVTAPGENILMSTILDARHFSLANQFLLSASVALTVRNFLERYAQSDLTIKWPNDIFFQNRKITGILIENLLTGNQWKWAIAGTGININQTGFAQGINNAVSLRQITGRQYDCLALAEELRQDLARTGNAPVTDADTVIAAYNQYLFRKDQKVTLQQDGNTFACTVRYVTPEGRLFVEKENGEAQYFEFGEVSWVL